ncbi:MAG: hypothetical protein R3B38_00020 [Patescibacteria group bacterium]
MNVKKPKLDISNIGKILAIGIAGYLIIGFVQSYFGASAGALLPGFSDQLQTKDEDNSGVCATCQQTGKLAPPCAGTCPNGQSCKLNVDTGLCGCYDK